MLHPEDGRPAPGALVLVQALVNTQDLLSGDDAIATPGAARDWLERAGLRTRMSRDELGRLHDGRTALRALVARNADVPAATPADALTALAGPLEARVAPDGAVTLGGGGTGVRRLLGDAVCAVHDAQVAGTWSRLKVCSNPECRWAFYDASRNRAGAWCSMAECGNRNKARRFRARHSGAMG